jgi:cysteinyl-tRNA synthetase
MSDEIRADAERLLVERAEARAGGRFAEADELRDQIALLGFDVQDGPSGSTLRPRPTFERVDPAVLPNFLGEPATLDASVHVLYEGFRADLERFVAGIGGSGSDIEVVVTDNASEDGAWLESLGGGGVRVVHLDRETGWAQARNAALRTSRGRVIVAADLSVEATGDMLRPLVRALENPSVGVAGPWGLVTEDLREFHEAPGPEVHAIEGYLIALRREVFAASGFDPWFTWYRHADLDLSFRVRAMGLRAVVVGVPAVRHTHRGWSTLPEAERATRSKRNFNRFLDHWRDRPDLIALVG